MRELLDLVAFAFTQHGTGPISRAIGQAVHNSAEQSQPLPDRPGDRPVHDRFRAGPGRLGNGVSRRARRQTIFRPGRGQDHRRECRGVLRPAVPGRTPDPGQPESSQHRPVAGRRRDRDQSALPGHGIHPRRARGSILRPESAGPARAARIVSTGLRRGAIRAPEPDRPSRHQARQHPGHRARPFPSCSTSVSPSCWTRATSPSRPT